MDKIIHSVREMAWALGRSPDYVEDMRRGGFKLPSTVQEAIEFIRHTGPPGRFRKLPLPDFSEIPVLLKINQKP